MNPIKLDNFPKIKPGFEVPDNYFEQFEVRLPESEVKVVQLKSTKKYWYMAVAAITLFAVSFTFIQNFTTEELVQPDQDSIVNYLSYNSGITTDDLINHLSEADIIELQNDQTLNSETIENYLIENNINEEYLID